MEGKPVSPPGEGLEEAVEEFPLWRSGSHLLQGPRREAGTSAYANLLRGL